MATFSPPAPSDIVSGGFTPPPPDSIQGFTPPPPEEQEAAPSQSTLPTRAPLPQPESAIAGGPQLRQAGAPGAGAELGQQFTQGAKDAWERLNTTPEFVQKFEQGFEQSPASRLISQGKQALAAASVSPPAAQEEGAADIGNTTASKVLEGTAGAVLDIPSYFTTPLGVATLGMGGLPKVAQRAVSAAFAAQMASQTPEIYKQLKDEIAKPPGQRDPKAIAEIVAKGVINTGFTVAAGLHAAGLPREGGENNATPIRSDQGQPGETGQAPQGGKADSSGNIQQGAPQPPEPVEQGEARKPSTSGRVGKYEVHGEDEGSRYVVTAPDGSVASTHASLQDARIAADEANKSPAQRKSAPAAQGRPSYSDEDLKAYSELDAKLKSPPAPGSNLSEVFNEKAELAKAQEALKNKYGGMTPQQLESQLSKGTPPLGSASPKSPPLQTKPSVPSVPKLSPEIEGHLNGVAKEMGLKFSLVDPSDESNPFAQRLQGGRIASIDRDTQQAVFDPKALEQYAKEAPPSQVGKLVRSVASEENNHLHVEDEDALAFAKTKTKAERAIIEDRYGRKGMSDLMFGHEAINFELHDLARMTPHQVLTETRAGRWKLQTLMALEKIIRNIRRAIGTKMSVEGDAILAKIQENLKLGRMAKSNRAKADMAAKALAEKDADKLESMADMYIQSGDAKTGEAMKATAARIRSESDQNPAARPRKRNESVFQDKFFLPGEATQKPAGSTQAVPISGESPTVPPEDRASAIEAGAPQRPTGPRIFTGKEFDEAALEHLQNVTKQASEAIAGGKTAQAPSFNDFTEYMHERNPALKTGQLGEMWHNAVGKFLEKASGEQLGDLVKAIWGRQVTEASAVGRKGFFRGIISGSQKVADLPESGQFKLAQDVYNRTPAERHQDERKVAAIARNRDKVIGALFNKLVKPVMEDIRLTDKETTPEDLRYGGGKAIPAVHEFSERDERNSKLLAEELVDDSRRSKNDPLTASKRLTAIVDRKSGSVDLVSTYKHPSLGTMLVDPLSPERQHSPLDSMLRRYRVIGSYLRDTPVQKFKQHFKNLADFNDNFANEARRQYQNETSYDPESISAEQFQREIGGRMQGTQEGHLMGPGKQLVTASGQSQLEKSQRTPMTTPEAHSILDYIHEQQGTIDSADDVREAMLTLKEDMNHQALSGLIKLARGLQEKNPDLSNEELLNLVAQRIYENNRDAENLDQFAKRTMAESRPTHVEDAGPEDSPAAINRRKIEEQRDYLTSRLRQTAVRTMVEIGRSPTRQNMATGLDVSENTAKVDARVVERSVRAPSMDEKNPEGKKNILAAAKAVIAAAGVKTRYHYDDEALAEADRLATVSVEQGGVKDYATWATRKRNLSDAKQKEEQNEADKQLQRETQRRLIESGHLNHSDATYYHDPKAKDMLDVFRMQVHQGLAKAERLSKGDAWDRFRAHRWKRGANQLLEELDFAKAHWNNPELIETAMRARRELDWQYDLEKSEGYNLRYDPEYLPGRYDGELFSQYGVLFSGLRVLGKQFRKAGTYKNYYEAIADGPYIPATQDIAAIVGSRARSGMIGLNRTKWWTALKGTKDEKTGKSLVADAKEVDGKSESPGQDYKDWFRTPDGKLVYVLEGYEGVMHELIDPSGLKHNILGKAALNASQYLKHTVLAGDVFHLMRVSYYSASIAGRNMRWRPGWAALDFRESDLPKAVQSKLISQETADWLTEKLPFKNDGVLETRNRMQLTKEFLGQGLNVAQIQDAIYKDLVRNVPGLGRYTKFLFDKWTRGHMMDNALEEYQRISRISPDDESRDIIRAISKDLNPYYGSIGRQGWIKSKTWQDIMQMTFLSPQWLEGLIKKEISPIRMLTQTNRVFQGKDTTLRGIGRGLDGFINRLIVPTEEVRVIPKEVADIMRSV